MQVSERRQRLRDLFASDRCIRPASVFDPVSARIAQALGFEFGMLGGSVASATVLGAPDLTVMTLTELAGQCYRITRASDLSLMVDADHGYGNVLSVMRTVQELKATGVSGMTIEDTVLPQRHGHQGQEELIPIEEMLGKLRAAASARQDPATVVLGRTHAINATSLEDAIERVQAYATTGVDAIFLVGVRETAQLAALRAVTALPLMLGTAPPALDNDTLATYGVRAALRGHGTFNASVKAIYESLKHQAEGGQPAEVADTFASPEIIGLATAGTRYDEWRADFL